MLFSLSPRGGRASRSSDNTPSPLASKVASDSSSSVSFAPADEPKVTTTGNNRRTRSASFDRTPSNVESGSGIKGRVGWKDEETSSHTGASDDDGDLRTISEADTESEQEDEGSGSRISASCAHSFLLFLLGLLLTLMRWYVRQMRKAFQMMNGERQARRAMLVALLQAVVG